MENKECIVERVSGTHLKPCIAVQNGDEKDGTKKRNDCAKASVELECEVIELGKRNCSSIWEQLNSSNLLRLWRTYAEMSGQKSEVINSRFANQRIFPYIYP